MLPQESVFPPERNLGEGSTDKLLRNVIQYVTLVKAHYQAHY